MIYFLPTIQHTASRFTRKFIGGIAGKPNLPFVDVAQFLAGKKGRAIYDHIDYFDVDSDDFNRVCAVSRIVIPMRDPLLSVIRCIHSHPDTAAPEARANQFLDLMRIEDSWEVHYLPVDVLAGASYEERLLALYSTAGTNEPNSAFRQTAKTWPLVGSKPYDLKSAYYDKDMEILSSLRGWSTLVKNQSVLRPWLERMGYKNLLWWT